MNWSGCTALTLLPASLRSALPWEDRDAGPGAEEQSQASRGAPDMALCLPQPQGPHPLMLVLKIRCDDVDKELRSFWKSTPQTKLGTKPEAK